MNSSSQLCLKSLSPLPMLSVSISIAELSRPCSAMKTTSRTLIAGSRILPLDKSAGKFSPNGCGTSVWNWAIASIRHLCAQPHLLRPKPHPFHHQFLILLLLSSTDYQSRREQHEWGSLPQRISPSNRMARCAVLQIIHSMPRSGEQSRME